MEILAKGDRVELKTDGIKIVDNVDKQLMSPSRLNLELSSPFRIEIRKLEVKELK